MNFEELSNNYMEKYKQLSEEREKSGITNVIEDINLAIKGMDMDRVNSNYSKILDWNSRLSNIEGERESINSQYKFLRLPSVTMFTIAFDEEEKKWKFKGEIH